MSQHILEQILDELKEIKSEQQEMKQALHHLQSTQNEMQLSLQSLQDKQDSMQSDLQTTLECVLSIESKQSSILEHSQIAAKLDNMATKDDLAYFDKKISEHEREIFKLKNA